MTEEKFANSVCYKINREDFHYKNHSDLVVRLGCSLSY